MKVGRVKEKQNDANPSLESVRDSVGEPFGTAAEGRAPCCLVRTKEVGTFVITMPATVSPYSAQVNR